MARKSKSVIKPLPTKLPAFPFCMGDRGAYIRKAWVAVEAMGKDYIASLYYEFAYDCVSLCAVRRDEIDVGGHQGIRPFYVDGYHTAQGPTVLAKTHLQWLKIQALRGGATPEAIRCISSAIKLTKKEEAEMAAKTNAKKTTAAKSKPVGGGGKIGKKGGNPEALAKAREAAAARNAENDKLKIGVKAKLADLKLRGGRLAKFEHIIKNKPKTVGDVRGTIVKDTEGKEHTIDMGALRGMEKRGHISIG